MSVGTPAGVLAAAGEGGSLAEICVGLDANSGVPVDGEAGVVTGCEAAATGVPTIVSAATVPASGSVAVAMTFFCPLSFKSTGSCDCIGADVVRLAVSGRS